MRLGIGNLYLFFSFYTLLFCPNEYKSLHFYFIFWNLCLFFCLFCIFEIRVMNLYENHGDTNN